MTLAQQSNTIQATWTNTYPDPIDHYQYRIGHIETGKQTDFSDWIEICGTDQTQTTTGTNTQSIATISSPAPHPNTGTCGGDSNTSLVVGRSYRIQVRAVDESRTDNPFVRNFVHPNKISYTTPTAMPPTTPPTTPTTMAPVTTPNTQPPSPTQPTTPTTPQTQPTTPTTPNTQAPAPHSQLPTPQANPNPAGPSGGNTGGPQVIVSGDNNTVIIGDNNTISFTDTSESVHEDNIVSLAAMGVTCGCNPPTNSRFCPDRAVTRAEMATFMVRAFDLPESSQDPFTDTRGNIHRSSINNMAAAGISRGCNPPANSRFCPDRAVTRAEMATFMTRVLGLEDRVDAAFDDTAGNVHTTNIQRFATAGITRGCNPPSNSRYCPDRAVSRAEMATFHVRSTDLNSGYASTPTLYLEQIDQHTAGSATSYFNGNLEFKITYQFDDGGMNLCKLQMGFRDL